MKYSELLKGSREKRLSSSSGQISKYGSAKNTVLASAAEAERVWSMADAVYANKRGSSLSPLIFQRIMFLKYNERFWGLADVVEANQRRLNKLDAAKGRRAALLERIKLVKDSLAEWDDFHAGLDSIEEGAEENDGWKGDVKSVGDSDDAEKE